MRLRRGEEGFTLIEMIVVTAIVAIVAGTLGTFFLAGTSPAVAAAGRDVTAAFDEARRTAVAFDAATVVFAPARSGSGYSARVYAGVPGDPAFAPRNGPVYESTVTISETAAPLGAPGFAFAVDGHGGVMGYAGFLAGQAASAARPCPATGTFTLHLAYERDVRIVAIPCALGSSNAAPAAFRTPAAAFTATPYPSPTCPGGARSPSRLAPAPGAASCPPGFTPDASVPGLCDAAAVSTAAPSSGAGLGPFPNAAPATNAPSAAPPNPTPCPIGFSGAAPACAGQIIEQYSAAADTFSAHASTLFANGSICDDDGCSGSGAIDWTWACAFGDRPGSNGTGGSNAPYQSDNAFAGSVSSMIGAAFHDAAEGNGDGVVSTSDSYCAGSPAPNP